VDGEQDVPEDELFGTGVDDNQLGPRDLELHTSSSEHGMRFKVRGGMEPATDPGVPASCIGDGGSVWLFVFSA